MAVVRWSPLGQMLNNWPDLWEEDLFPTPSAVRNSSVEVYETEKEVVVKANVAGVPEDKIDLTFEKGVLYITAQIGEEQKDENTQDGRTYYARWNQQYSYTVRVPGEIDHSEEPNVEYDKGVLTITFSKSRAAQPRKLMIGKKAEK